MAVARPRARGRGGRSMGRRYFRDDLFRFQTYISGEYEIGHQKLVSRSAGAGAHALGLGRLPGRRGWTSASSARSTASTPDLKKNYKRAYLDRHDPMDGIEDSSTYGHLRRGHRRGRRQREGPRGPCAGRRGVLVDRPPAREARRAGDARRGPALRRVRGRGPAGGHPGARGARAHHDRQHPPSRAARASTPAASSRARSPRAC